MQLKPYKVKYLYQGNVEEMYLYDYNKNSLRKSIIKHWNANLVFDAKIISIEDCTEDELLHNMH